MCRLDRFVVTGHDRWCDSSSAALRLDLLGHGTAVPCAPDAKSEENRCFWTISAQAGAASVNEAGLPEKLLSENIDVTTCNPQSTMPTAVNVSGMLQQHGLKLGHSCRYVEATSCENAVK